MLPPGEFNGVIPDPASVYPEDVTTTAATVSLKVERLQSQFDNSRLSALKVVNFKIRWATLGLFTLTMAFFKNTHKQQQNVMLRGTGPHDFIHSMKRNRLTGVKSRDLFYVHSNLLLLDNISAVDYTKPQRSGCE